MFCFTQTQPPTKKPTSSPSKKPTLKPIPGITNSPTVSYANIPTVNYKLLLNVLFHSDATTNEEAIVETKLRAFVPAVRKP